MPKRCPRIGEKVYLPPRTGANLFFGGMTKVIAVEMAGKGVGVYGRARKAIRTEADPDKLYFWFDIEENQKVVKEEARVATPAELQAELDVWKQGEAARLRAEIAKWAPHNYALAGANLLEVPVWDPHHRAKNWAATVQINGTMPGGLERKWWPRGRGAVFYIIPTTCVGDVVEFAADYVQVSGKSNPVRYYGVVRAIDSYCLTLQRYPTQLLAFKNVRGGEPSLEAPQTPVDEKDTK